MPTEPEITVTLTDSEFTLTELQHFIEKARSIDGIDQDALVSVKMPNASSVASSGPVEFELSASSAYRAKYT